VGEWWLEGGLGYGKRRGSVRRPERGRQSRHALRRKSDKKGRQEVSPLTSCWLGTCILASCAEYTNCTAIGLDWDKKEENE
jgi:hypothetical protein